MGYSNEYKAEDWVKTLDTQSSFDFNEEAQKAVSGLLSLKVAHPNDSDRRPMRRDSPSCSSPQRPIVVAAPIPISYAVRNRSALRFMLSIGEERDESNSETASENTLAQHSHFKQAFSSIDQPANTESKITFRPISPGTLITLADPCILSRCAGVTPPPIEYPLPAIFQHNGHLQALPAPFPAVTPGLDTILSLVEGSEYWVLPSASQNMWGY